MKSSFRIHASESIKLAVPVILSQLSYVLMGIADTIQVGRLGPVALSATGFAANIIIIPMVAGIGITFGLTPLVSAADGAQDLNRAGRLFRSAFVVNIGLALMLMALCFGVIPLLPLFGVEASIIEAGRGYYALMAISVVPVILMQTVKQFVEGLSDTKAAMYINLSAALFNIILNELFIFGHGPFPQLGVTGAGVATLLCRIYMMAAQYVYVFVRKKYARYRFNPLKGPYSWAEMKEILKIGLPIGSQYFFEVGCFALAAIMAGVLGATQMAAHQIAISLAAATFMAGMGLSAAVSIRVGNFFGAQDRTSLRAAGITGLTLILGFEALTCLLFILTNDFWPALFINNAEVVALASQLLILAGIFQFSDGVQVVALGALRGVQDVRIPTWITLVAYWGIALPLAWYLGVYSGYGVQGIWISLVIGLTVAASILSWRFLRLSQTLRFPQNEPVAETQTALPS